MFPAATTIPMQKRVSVDGSASGPALWIDASRAADLVTRALQSGYNGVITPLASLDRYQPLFSERVTGVVEIAGSEELERLIEIALPVVVASRNAELLSRAQLLGFRTAFRAYVVDAASLHQAIHVGKLHDFVVMSFKDPTNIPLELVIASLQTSHTILIKEIDPNAMEDALVTRGVMEVGADGILFSPTQHTLLENFLTRWQEAHTEKVALEEGKVLQSRPVGMGYRSCIDLATLFTPQEGMLVGSTSQGGIFCCPEVFHLPYMELRPFRVNAGAVHSYIYNFGNRTDYMTELRAGSPVMVVNHDGSVRRAHVGRMKTEVRPLRLIEVGFSGGRNANILLQDDWHVRIYSADGQPLNITELKTGDKVLGHVAEPGRHVGIKVSEHIIEN